MYKRVLKAGGRIERRRIESFEDSKTFDLIINCTEVEALALAKDEKELNPVRGQVIRVKTTWVLDVFLDDFESKFSTVETILFQSIKYQYN